MTTTMIIEKIKTVYAMSNTYDKPKVTIDLDEYNDLKEKVNAVTGDEYVQDAKKVIAAFINSRMDIRRTTETLQRQGIQFTIVNQMSDPEIRPENVVIKRQKTIITN